MVPANVVAVSTAANFTTCNCLIEELIEAAVQVRSNPFPEHNWVFPLRSGGRVLTQRDRWKDIDLRGFDEIIRIEIELAMAREEGGQSIKRVFVNKAGQEEQGISSKRRCTEYRKNNNSATLNEEDLAKAILAIRQKLKENKETKKDLRDFLFFFKEEHMPYLNAQDKFLSRLREWVVGKNDNLKMTDELRENANKRSELCHQVIQKYSDSSEKNTDSSEKKRILYPYGLCVFWALKSDPAQRTDVQNHIVGKFNESVNMLATLLAERKEGSQLVERCLKELTSVWLDCDTLFTSNYQKNAESLLKREI